MSTFLKDISNIGGELEGKVPREEKKGQSTDPLHTQIPAMGGEGSAVKTDGIANETAGPHCCTLKQ